MSKVQTLDARVNSFWKKQDASSAEGLTILKSCIEEAASANRNWDPLARFYSGAMRSGRSARIAKIIRLAFGDKLTWKADSKLVTGGKFTIGWEGAFDLRSRNSFNEVMGRAIASNMGWDSKVFNAAISEVLPAKEKPAPKVTQEALEKKAKTLAKSIKEMASAGASAGELMRLIQLELQKG